MTNELDEDNEWERDVDTFEACVDTIDTDQIGEIADELVNVGGDHSER